MRLSQFTRDKLSQLPLIKQLLWKVLPNGVYCFNYHRIGVSSETQFDPNVFSCTAETFEQHLIFFKQHFELISISQLHTLHSQPDVKKKYAVITFDDGYHDNYDLAFPLLKKHNVPAALFVATDFIDQKCIPWWDETAWLIRQCSIEQIAATGWMSINQLASLSVASRIKAILKVMKQDRQSPIEEKLQKLRIIAQQTFDNSRLEQKLFADWKMIKEMANNGVTIGSHTCSHRILSHLSNEEQQQELTVSKAKIEQNIATSVEALAYPVGGINSFNESTIKLTKAAGYNIAFSYINGKHSTLTKALQYQLRRIPVDNNQNTQRLMHSIVRAANIKPTTSARDRVLVLAAGPNGLGVLRSLHKENLDVTMLTLSKKDISHYSHIPSQKHTIVGINNAEKHQWLLSFLLNQPKNITIIPTSDWFVSFLTQHINALHEHCNFVLPNGEVTDLLIDKALETQAIEKVVPIPKTIQKITDKQQLIAKLGLPIIIKPRSHKHMVLGQKNIVIHTQQQADEFFNKFFDKLDNLIAQEVISGDDHQQWVCNCVFDTNSDMVQGFTFNRLKLSPSHYGVTSYARSEHNQEILALSKIIGKSIKFVGPAMLEFKKDPQDGKYKYIELNPRLGMCNFFDTSCGINNAYTTYLLAAGKEVPTVKAMQSDVMFLSFFEDFFSRKQDGEATLNIFKDYYRQHSKKHIFIYYVWWDPYPAIHLATRQIVGFLKSSLKKISQRLAK